MNEAVLVAAANYAEALSHAKHLPPTSPSKVEMVRHLEQRLREYSQLEFTTEHVFHAGMYARTVRIPAGVVFTSVLIKVPTLLILRGACDVFMGHCTAICEGYNVITAEAGRKTAYITRSDIELTMIFPTTAKTVEEAEAEFSDEADSLLSRSNANDIVVTEAACLESQPQPRS